MADRQRPDPDERFSLFPEEGEDVLRRLLYGDKEPGADEGPEAEDSP